MASIRQINASRRNGALSNGPITEDGKLRSSTNAQRHGLLADCLVLRDENSAGFQALLTDHLERFQPANEHEVGIIEKMVAADWRMRRLWAIENKMFNDSLSDQTSDDGLTCIERTFSGISESSPYNLLQRYETRLDRMYHRALRNFTHARAAVPPPQPSPAGDSPQVSNTLDRGLPRG